MPHRLLALLNYRPLKSTEVYLQFFLFVEINSQLAPPASDYRVVAKLLCPPPPVAPISSGITNVGFR
jgi:hypothetical protein